MISALSIGEILSVGSLTTVIGLATTFFTLILLVYILSLMKKLNRKDKSVEIEKAPAVTAQSVRQDDSVIAAITAAISMILSEESGATNKSRASFVVKSIKRI